MDMIYYIDTCRTISLGKLQTIPL